MPAWRRYEQDIAKLIESFEDVSLVEHDTRRNGRISGHSRQVDVRVEGTTMGLATTVAVECKLLANPIGIGLVDQFHGKLADLGADKGVMYSEVGYTAPGLARGHSEHQYQPRIALLTRSATFDYEAFLVPDCPNENCHTGSVNWERPGIDLIPDHSFGAGSCDACGTTATRCADCGSINAFFWNTVACEGCGASWTIEYDRNHIESVIRQLTNADGQPIEV